MLAKRQLANAIRALSMDAVQKANSGHPGMPMGMADIAEVLWNDFLRHNPKNLSWPNRDRFILSNGHGSMLLYSLLHLTGYDLSLDDLKNFRQLNSKTPGHPEYGVTLGVETTTGPLGQGLANAVGMAIGEAILSAEFNQENFSIIDHFTYVFVGDGCLMEGVSHEVCSLAGTLGLNKLIVFWDDNGISIDGETKNWFNENTAARFLAYNWQVINNVDGHDAAQIKAAILQAQASKDKPTIICCKTIIGFGAPNKANKASAHGAPLGEKEVALARTQLNWLYEPFFIPQEIYNAWDAKEKGTKLNQEWQKLFEAYKNQYPELAAEFMRRLTGALPNEFNLRVENYIQRLQQESSAIATRKISQNVLEEIGHYLPELLGGSADLTESNLTNFSGSKAFSKMQHKANYIYYGVREFGMSAITNGLSLYGGFIPYSGTFLVFYSYAVSAVRMAAIMKKRNIFIYTHDSIGLGEDGPTHQPIEQISTLRITPNVSVWRPADAVETIIAWHAAITRTCGPTAILLSRQVLPAQTHNDAQIKDIKRGGYILKDCIGIPDGIIIATGSEVQIAMIAWEVLNKENYKIRIVSMPSTDVFLQQENSYQESVLPYNVVRRVVIEAGCTNYWYRFVGQDGKVIGIDSYGESAPGNKLFEFFKLTAENVSAQMRKILSSC